MNQRARLVESIYNQYENRIAHLHAIPISPKFTIGLTQHLFVIIYSQAKTRLKERPLADDRSRNDRERPGGDESLEISCSARIRVVVDIEWVTSASGRAENGLWMVKLLALQPIISFIVNKYRTGSGRIQIRNPPSTIFIKRFTWRVTR